MNKRTVYKIRRNKVFQLQLVPGRRAGLRQFFNSATSNNATVKPSTNNKPSTLFLTVG